jgi:phosphatidylglycerol:prolipoprotein diacylglycerol transferase
MLPYFESTSFPLLGLTLQTWGTFVAAGFLLGAWLAVRRAKSLGLEGQRIWDLAGWILLTSFVGARLFHVLFYAPGYYLDHPWQAIDPREPGFSMFGGLIGAGLVFWWYVRRHALDLVAYADVLIWGVPWGCGVGRIGCFLIHDHPGTLTNFTLGVKYPDGQTRHDLGLYLSLIGFALGLAFLWLNRKKRQPGFWVGAFMIVEGASRFVLDFLRLADVRYLGLTPTQYLSVPLFVAGVILIRRGGRVLQ